MRMSNRRAIVGLVVSGVMGLAIGILVGELAKIVGKPELSLLCIPLAFVSGVLVMRLMG